MRRTGGGPRPCGRGFVVRGLVGASTVAEKSAVPAFDSGWVSDRDVIAKIFEAVDVVVRNLRPRLDDTEKSDLVTQDLLIEITGALEEARWMWQAQNAGFEGS